MHEEWSFKCHILWNCYLCSHTFPLLVGNYQPTLSKSSKLERSDCDAYVPLLPSSGQREKFGLQLFVFSLSKYNRLCLKLSWKLQHWMRRMTGMFPFAKLLHWNDQTIYGAALTVIRVWSWTLSSMLQLSSLFLHSPRWQTEADKKKRFLSCIWVNSDPAGKCHNEVPLEKSELW